MIDPQEISEDDSSSTSEELINAAPPARYEDEDAAAAAALPDEPNPSPADWVKVLEHHLMLFDKLDRGSLQDCTTLYKTYARTMMQIATAHCGMAQALDTDELSIAFRELNADVLLQLAEKSKALGKMIVAFPDASA